MKLSEPVLRKHLQGYLRLLQKDELTDSLTLLQLYSTYQYYHYQNGNQDSVYHYLTKQSAYLGPGTPAHYYRNHYNLLGIIFFKKREYELAYKMGRLAYQYALQTNTTLSGLGRMQLNLVSYALEMNKPEEARGILNQLLRENPSMPDFQLNSVSRYYVYREFSKLYTKTKQYDSALHFASLMAKVYEKSGGTTHQSLWYNNIMQKGRIFQAMDKCPEAEECFRQVYQSAGNSQFSKARRVEAIIELAHLAIHRKSIEEANRFLKEAFSQSELNSASWQSTYYSLFIRWHHAYAQLQWARYQQAPESDSLRQAVIKSYVKTNRMLWMFRQYAVSMQDKSRILMDFSHFHEEILHHLHSIYQKHPSQQLLEQVLGLMDLNQATRLQDKLYLDDALSESQKKVYQELAVERSMTLWDETLSAEQKQRRLDSLDTNLQLLYGNYAQEKTRYCKLKLKDFLFQLERRKVAYLDFHLGKKHVYLLLLTAEHQEFLKLKIDESFRRNLREVFQALYQKTSRRLAFSGKRQARELYRFLIEPISHRIAHYKNLLITPNQELSYIPFDVLRKPDGRYMIEDQIIFYAPSASLWMHSQHNKRRLSAMNPMLAMAPFAEKRQSTPSAYPFEIFRNSRRALASLPYSRKEVESVSEKPVLGEQASKKFFMDKADEFPIIHLATHAIASENNPDLSYIQFFPSNQDLTHKNRLYAHEIQHLKLDNTLLLTLSACNTGNGQLLVGEGIMSLSRAFQQAGVSNVLFTHWVAEDKSTAQLIEAFYRNLNDGMGKAEALWKAKIDFMKAQEAHGVKSLNPFYWANLQLSGNNAPLLRKRRLPVYWLLLGMGLLCGAVLVRYRYWRFSKKR
ncbi:MAG: CHAT domain-containing protein [Cytophagales bacterium]|nr:CHAT domain-containing protein [Cytophagales bacterium]